MKSKRPWKKWARIVRIELNNGDVKFRAEAINPDKTGDGMWTTCESLTEAEAHVDAWWAEWWPKQTKSRRRA